MSGRPETVTEQQVQEDLLRLDAYRDQLNAMLQQHQILEASRADHARARESLEGIDTAPATAEFLLPLGGEAFVRGEVNRDAPILIGIGSGVVAEMERPKVVELLAQRLVRIDEASRELEGQMSTLNDRIQSLSRRLDAIARSVSGPGDVGRH